MCIMLRRQSIWPSRQPVAALPTATNAPLAIAVALLSQSETARIPDRNDDDRPGAAGPGGSLAADRRCRAALTIGHRSTAMSQPASVAADRIFRLMYRSHDKIAVGDRRAELGSLFSQARSANKKKNITGALLLYDDWFVQTLEGDEGAVRALFGHIETDPRHDQVSLIDAQDVGERVFGRWSMARVAEDGETDIPLIAHSDGIAEAAGRTITAPQQELLDTMRKAAKDSPTAG